MNWQRLFLLATASGCSLFLLLSSAACLAQAQLEESVSSSQNHLRFNLAPGQHHRHPHGGGSRGAGSRGGENLCNQPVLPLMALVPTEKQNTANKLERVLGLTADDHPTFWFYVPYEPKPGLLMQFQLRSQQNGIKRTIYQVQQPLSQKLVSISLPQIEPPLEIDTNYEWVLKIRCVANDRSADDVVTGWVSRVPLPVDLQASLQTAKLPKQRVKLYAEAGLWHETITTLVNELTCQDRQLARSWLKDLLQTAGVDEVTTGVQQSLLNRCDDH